MKKKITRLSIALALVVLLASCTPSPAPELAVSLPSTLLLRNSPASIHVKVTNTGKDDWQNHTLYVGYAQENDPKTIQIVELAVPLVAGQTFEQDVTWLTDLQAIEGAKYQVRLILVSGNIPIANISTPVEFIQPTVSLSINPAQLAGGQKTLIHVQVHNPSGVAMQGYRLNVGYGAPGDPINFVIEDLSVNLRAGETLTRDIRWGVDYIERTGNFEIRATLLMPSSIFVAQSIAPITLTALK